MDFPVLPIRIYLYLQFITYCMPSPLPRVSPFEQDVLNILWNGNAMLVRDIHAILKLKRKVAHTSVAVILDRLRQKGLAGRKTETCRGGTRYWYYSKTPKHQFARRVLDSSINSLVERFGSTAITYFEERFSRRRPRP